MDDLTMQEKTIAATQAYNDAVSAAQALDQRYTDVATYNNTGLLARDQGPGSGELLALNNYWALVASIKDKESGLHTTADDFQLITPDPNSQAALDRWFVDTGGSAFQDKRPGFNGINGIVDMKINENSMTVSLNVRFKGRYAQERHTNGSLYKDIVMQGIQDKWSGRYWIDGQWVYFTVNVSGFVPPKPGGFGVFPKNVISISLNGKNTAFGLASGINYSGLPLWWSNTRNLGISLNVLYDNGTERGKENLMSLAAHEIGHQFGIPDAYPGSFWSATMKTGAYHEDAMMYRNGDPLVLDIFTMVTSRTRNRMVTRKKLNTRFDWCRDFDIR